MKTIASILILVLFSFCLLYGQSEGDYRSFQSGNWHSSETWEVVIGGEWVLSSSIPAAATANNVTVRSGHTVTVNNHITIDQLVVEADAQVIASFDKNIIVSDGAGDDMVVYGSLTTSGTTNQGSIGLSGNGKVIIHGDYYWQSGGITNTDFWVAPSGTLHLDGSVRIMRQNAVLNNQGTVLHYHNGGYLAGVGNSIFNNLEGGVYHAMGSCQIRYVWDWDWNDQYTFNNYGTILKSTADTDFTIYRGTFNNHGTVQIQDGNLYLEGMGSHTSSGSFELQENCIFRIFNNANLTLQSGAQFSGTGKVLLNPGGTTTALTIDQSGVTFAEACTLELESGTIFGTGQMTMNGELLFKAGKIHGPQIDIGTTGIFRIQSGDRKIFAAGTINNYGQFLNEVAQSLDSCSGAVINNHPGAIINLMNDGSINYDSALGGASTILNNFGNLLKSGGDGTSTLGKIVLNNHLGALINVQSGTLRLKPSGTGTNSSLLTIAEDCTFSITDNGDWGLGEDSVINGSGSFKLIQSNLLLTGTGDGASIGENIDFQMHAGNITNPGKLTVLGDMLWSGGNISCGDLIFSANSIVTANGSTAELHSSGSGYIRNYGHFILSAGIGSGDIHYQNKAGATFEFTSGSGFWHGGGGSGPSSLVNDGLLLKTGDSSCSLNQLNTTNNATIEVQQGTLYYDSSNFNNLMQVNIFANAKLKLKPSTSSSGNGDYQLAQDAILELSEGYPLNCQEGTEITGLGELRLSTGGDLNTLGTTMGLQIAETIAINQYGGHLGGNGKIFYNGTHNWTEGDIFVGNYYLGADGILNLTGSGTKRMGNGTFHNNGTVNMMSEMGGGNLNFNINDGATLNIGENLSVWHTGGGSNTPILNNYGLVHKTGSGYSNFDVCALNNYGTFWLEAGSIRFYAGSSTHYNDVGSGAEYLLAGKLILRYGGFSTNNVDVTLDGALGEIRDEDDVDLLAACTGTSASGSFTLQNGANLVTNGNFSNNGTLDLGTGYLGGAGNFTAAGNSSLIIGSVDGISLSESSGNIQKTGSRTYSTTGNYTYNGLEMQNAGDGLPDVVRSLTVNNPGLVIGASLAVTQTLNLLGGVIHIPDLTLGSSVSAGTLLRENGHIHGDFCIWLETTDTEVLFPIGTASHYRPVQLSFDDPHVSGGSLYLSTIYEDPGLVGLPLTDDGTELTNMGTEAYWRLSAEGGLQTGSYSIGILAAGYGGINDYSALHLLWRSDDQSPWQSDGTHIPCTGSNEAPLISRSGLNSFGDFGLGSTSLNFISLGSVQNLQISTSIEGITLIWDILPGANTYRVYVADDPYPEFPSGWELLEDAIIGNTWLDSSSQTHRFYRVTGSD